MKKENLNAYENATQGLLRKLESMNLPLRERLQAKNLTLLFRDSFKLGRVQHDTFYSEIGYNYKKFPYPSYGFCRASSFSFLAIMNNSDWKLMYIDKIWTYGPHFFILHAPSDTIFDLTFDQYAYNGLDIPYDLGRPVQMDYDAKNTITRFLNAAGLDFMQAIKNIEKD
ncbi:hypothetical protein HDR61_02785 [bacterium]|nr:hypothetical protein [bacterium]